MHVEKVEGKSIHLKILNAVCILKSSQIYTVFMFIVNSDFYE